MEEDDESLPLGGKAMDDEKPRRGFLDFMRAPMEWFRMLSNEMHWSFVMGVVVVYGINQGLGGGLGRVGTEYYWKDVQKVQPSEAQVYSGITYIPWIVKPLWGLLTDVVPIVGYRRRPYFIFAGNTSTLCFFPLVLYRCRFVWLIFDLFFETFVLPYNLCACYFMMQKSLCIPLLVSFIMVNLFTNLEDNRKLISTSFPSKILS